MEKQDQGGSGVIAYTCSTHRIRWRKSIENGHQGHLRCLYSMGIKSSIWLKVKFYPLPLMIASLFSIIVRSIYYSIIYRNMIYIKAIISSTKKINYVWANRKVIDSKIVKSLVTADSILFTR